MNAGKALHPIGKEVGENLALTFRAGTDGQTGRIGKRGLRRRCAPGDRFGHLGTFIACPAREGKAPAIQPPSDRPPCPPGIPCDSEYIANEAARVSMTSPRQNLAARLHCKRGNEAVGLPIRQARGPRRSPGAGTESQPHAEPASRPQARCASKCSTVSARCAPRPQQA